jgi:hypothetical protein
MLTNSKEAINSSDINNSRDARAETQATAGAPGTLIAERYSAI